MFPALKKDVCKMYFKTYEKFEQIDKKKGKDNYVALSPYICNQETESIRNNKKIFLQNGDLMLVENEISQILSRSRPYVKRFLNLACEQGLFVRNKIRDNIVIYTLSEVFFSDEEDSFEAAKKHNQTDKIVKGEYKKRWIKDPGYAVPDDIDEQTQKREEEEWDRLVAIWQEEQRIKENIKKQKREEKRREKLKQ